MEKQPIGKWRETGEEEIPLTGQDVNADREGEQETRGPWGLSSALLHSLTSLLSAIFSSTSPANSRGAALPVHIVSMAPVLSPGYHDVSHLFVSHHALFLSAPPQSDQNLKDSRTFRGLQSLESHIRGVKLLLLQLCQLSAKVSSLPL